MAFMAPKYTRADFHTGENDHGEGTSVPADTYGNLDRFAEECGLNRETCKTVTGKYWYRLSADGYMDATDWCGPFDSLFDAMLDCHRTFDVNPYTGDEDEDGLPIKLENSDDDNGLVNVYCDYPALAKDDQSIHGSRWEISGDMTSGLAYASILDERGLVETLKSEGYDVDDSEYSPPTDDDFKRWEAKYREQGGI